jgi:hypothetical protein
MEQAHFLLEVVAAVVVVILQQHQV